LHDDLRGSYDPLVTRRHQNEVARKEALHGSTGNSFTRDKVKEGLKPTKKWREVMSNVWKGPEASRERCHNGQQRIRQSASKQGEQYESQAVFLLAGKLTGA
jgi:hypothetical protein